MKIKRATYFSAFLLCCFLFSTIAGIAFSYSTSKTSCDCMKTQAVSAQDNGLNISGGFNVLPAENEDGNDYSDVFHSHEFIIPFIFSFVHTGLPQYIAFQPAEVSVKDTSPIYIAVRNFRI